MKKIIMSFIIGLFLVGCASVKTVPLSPQASSGLKDRSVVLIKRESPNFVAMTSGKGAFAVVGVGAAIKAGNNLVREKNIEDPALEISRSVAKVLESRYGIEAKDVSHEVVETGDVNEIIQYAEGQDYVLDVATTAWSFMYDGFHLSDYLVGYSAKLRLIDVKTGNVLAEGLCTYNWKEAGKDTVSYDELLANDAAVIKQHLAESVDHCTRHYSTELFQI